MTGGPSRDAVLVTGPRLAGVGSVAAVLRDRLPGRVIVEPVDLGAGELPAAVVFVVSAAAALTASDCALLDGAAAGTDVVVCAVTKIDRHRGWPATLVGNRAALAVHAPRYRRVAWAGVAAAPAAGPPQVDDLVAAVRTALARPDLGCRNRLRLREARLRAAVARVTELRRRRAAVLRYQRRTHTQRVDRLRHRLRQAHLQLCYLARHRCASARSELQAATAALGRRDLGGFEARVRARLDAVIGEVAEQTTARLADVARRTGLTGVLPPPEPAPPVPVAGPGRPARPLEARLMTLLAAGFGLGAAVSVSRTWSWLFQAGPPGWGAAGLLVGPVVGAVITVWVVRTRRVLHDRVVADRWVAEVTALLRSVVDQLVATRVLAAEAALAGALGARQDAAAARVAEQVSVIDAELRDRAGAASLTALQRALTAVRAELGEPADRCGAIPPHQSRTGHDILY